jgi:prepilin-type N-terminal cleavage/methylation domain-containing protein
MTLNNIKKMKNQKGFTIVELLIVIVIIGILAALVIVAYNGIQNRARATQYQTDAQAIQKKAEALAADNSGVYPSAAATFTGDLGTLPSGVAVVVTTATAGNQTNSIKTSAALAAADNDVMSSVGSTRTYAIRGCGSGTGLRIYYADPTTGTANANVKSVVAGTGC